jgi:hypothetical protein
MTLKLAPVTPESQNRGQGAKYSAEHSVGLLEYLGRLTFVLPRTILCRAVPIKDSS